MGQNSGKLQGDTPLLSSALWKGYTALADQTLISATNFLTGLLLARHMAKEEYGGYVVAFTVLLLIYNLQRAVVTGPMVVLGSSRDAVLLQRYVSATAMMQVSLGTVITTVLIVVVFIFNLLLVDSQLANSFAGLAFAAFAFQGQEFVRQVLFMRLDPAGAFRNDLVAYGLRLVGIGILYHMNALSGKTTFWAIGMASGVAACMGLWQCRSYIVADLADWKATWRDNWRLGKWMLLQSMARYFSGQIYIFAIALYLGTVAVGRFEASRLILGPIQVLTQGLSNIIAPFLARAYKRYEPRDFRNMLAKGLGAWSLAFGAACIGIATFAPWLLFLLYGQKYSGEVGVVRIFAIGYFLSALGQYTTLIINAIRRPELGWQASVIALGATVLLIWPLMGLFGVRGGAMGGATSALSVLIVQGVLVISVLAGGDQRAYRTFISRLRRTR